MKLLIITIILCSSLTAAAQNKPKPKPKSPITIGGTIGAGYEGYGLHRNPAGWTGYTPRRPYNQFRFNVAPTFNFGKNFKLPLNFNFVTKPTNFAGGFAGLPSFGGQTFGQFISNPTNSFALNPKYKNSELLLGTQYLNYSNLSTGDIAVFGAGVDLHPGDFIIKAFTGLSQQPINYVAPTIPNPAGVVGAYRRNNWMMQLGKEKEGKYKVAFNFSKGRDHTASLRSPLPTAIKPQEGFTVSFLSNVNFNKGWYLKSEIAQAYFTKDLFTTNNLTKKSFQPFLTAKNSTVRDLGADLSFGKKLKTFEIGLSTKFLGPGFLTPGYPFAQSDRLDYVVNTKFNAWQNKMNIVASAGQRINNFSTSGRAAQFLGNLNWFTQFNDKWNLNVTYSNFGFTAPSGSSFGVKNVSNDFGVNPTYTHTTSKMMHLLSMSYNYSKYDERDIFTGVVTNNNTHTALLSYVPVFFNKKITPDFSVMYFKNHISSLLINTSLLAFTAGVGYPFPKNRGNIKGQVQYTIATNNVASSNNNAIASCTIDYKLKPKLMWRTFLSSNYLKYELGYTPQGANYLESQYRTGITYQLGK
jgi:hypothetical protein